MIVLWLWLFLGWVPALYLARLAFYDTVSTYTGPDTEDYVLGFIFMLMFWMLAPLVTAGLILYRPAKFIAERLGKILFPDPNDDPESHRYDV